LDRPEIMLISEIFFCYCRKYLLDYLFLLILNYTATNLVVIKGASQSDVTNDVTKWFLRVMSQRDVYKWCLQVMPTSDVTKGCHKVMAKNDVSKWCQKVMSQSDVYVKKWCLKMMHGVYADYRAILILKDITKFFW